MTTIDLAILAMVTVSCVVLLYYRSRLASLGIFRSVMVILELERIVGNALAPGDQAAGSSH